MDEEELVLQFTEERNLITSVGYIPILPNPALCRPWISIPIPGSSGCCQSHSPSFVLLIPLPNFGIFRLTDPPGLDVILTCAEKDAFHPHPDLPIYTDADKGHVHMKSGSLEIVDLR
ncbi:hypothetical protein FA13DRAFT_1721617 [Coprinellus micaceus]|uniref:Uncharacterized protein n=1 Tax=Coprinellus micaceus TaxID=71717 RepID=A0A4Y7RYV3_COPMI|nr:hypothetical protein FA13DRAFT_1721617 [Coprinellus micaceus]